MSFEALSPTRPASRSHSRASSRSIRAPSPSVAGSDSAVAIRNQMSTLKHTIRHQQAQLHTLENVLLSGPRPLPPGLINSPPTPTDDMHHRFSTPISPPSSYNLTSSPSITTKIQRRSSFEVLHDLAGRDSQLPLPKKENAKSPEDIKEGVPSDFRSDNLSPINRRMSSPTRTLSRIPVASVGHARTLAEEGESGASPLPPSPVDGSILNSSLKAESLSASSSSLQIPLSPNRRTSMSGGNTSKVLADLQAGVTYTRNALENTKSQLRASQRNVAQLTRQVEDLKESRERMRLENEGLNNVVARKERLLQEVLERARKAEAEAATLKTQLKSETSASKKHIRDMEIQMAEASATSQKSEREYMTLRDALKQLTSSSKADIEELRRDAHGRECQWRKDAELVATKYRLLLDEVQKEREEQATASRLRDEQKRIHEAWEISFRVEMQELRDIINKSEKESSEAGKNARNITTELSRLKRLMRAVEEDSLQE